MSCTIALGVSIILSVVLLLIYVINIRMDLKTKDVNVSINLERMTNIDNFDGEWVLYKVLNGEKGPFWNKVKLNLKVLTTNTKYEGKFTIDNKATLSALVINTPSGLQFGDLFNFELDDKVLVLFNNLVFRKVNYDDSAIVDMSLISKDNIDRKSWSTFRSKTRMGYQYNFMAVTPNIMIVTVNDKGNHIRYGVAIKTPDGNFTEYNSIGRIVAKYHHRDLPIDDMNVVYTSSVNSSRMEDLLN